MLMKCYIFLIPVLLLISVLAEEPLSVYRVSLTLNDDGSIVLDNLYLTTAFKGRDFLNGPYTLRLISLDGDSLYIDRFDFEGTAPPREWFDENGKQVVFPKRLTKPTKEIISRPISRVTLSVPYFNKGKEIQIYNPDGELALSIDLSIYCEGEGCLRKGSLFSRFTRWLDKIF